MAIKWAEHLTTSVTEIDDQHKELFKKMHELHLACRRGKGKAEIGNAIQFLDDYVREHFKAEEKYMQAHAYPGYASHKSEHTYFTRAVTDLKRQLEAEGASLPLVIKTNLKIAEWLRNHIRKADMNLESFLKSRALRQDNQEI
jgi:hemerythrin